MTLINAPEMAFANIQKIWAILQDDCTKTLDPNRVKMLKQSLKDYAQFLNSMEFSVEEEYKQRTVKHSYVLKFDAHSELIIALKHTMVSFINGNAPLKLVNRRSNFRQTLVKIRLVRKVLQIFCRGKHNIDSPRQKGKQ